MELIYMSIFICVIFAELLPRINTDGVLKQIALCLMAVGAMVALAGRNESILSIGIAIYLIHNIYYAMRKNRRRDDHSRIKGQYEPR